MTIATPQDLQQATPDAHVWAKNILDAKKVKNKKAPEDVDLAKMITNVQINGAWKGTDNLVITILDPAWKLLDSGFWDLDENGALDLVDVNYPDGSRFWWRMTQVSPQADFLTELTFLDRIAVELMSIFGPVKTNRASHTRAQFLQELASKVPEIDYHSLELDIVQPIAGSSVATGTQSGVSQGASGTGGFWEVPFSDEDDPIGHTTSFGPLGTHMGYSILSRSGTAGDAGTAGQAISPYLGGGERMIFVNPANGRSVTAPLVDRGGGSDSILPVVGLYADLRHALGYGDSGSGTVRIKRANGQPMTCARGHQV